MVGSRGRRAVRVALAACLLASLAAAGTGSAGTGSAATPADEPVLHETVTVALTPDTPGSVRVTLRYEVPHPVEELRVFLPPAVAARATWTDATGFTTAGANLTWDGQTATPTATYRLSMPRNRTGAPHQSVDAGRYALVVRPWGGVGYATTADVRFERTLRPAGRGLTNGRAVYLGAGRIRSRTANGSRFRTVVAPGADPRVAPGRALAALTTARRHFDVGTATDDLLVVVLPDGYLRGAEAGHATRGGATATVEASAPLATWLHEYVHTRQEFTTTPATRWLVEGTATYYGDAFAANLGAAEPEVADGGVGNATLADPATWPDRGVAYAKGSRVAAALDAAIRNRTDGRRDLRDVLRRVNRGGGDLTYGEFRSAVVDVGGADLGPWLDRYVRSGAAPPRPPSYRRVLVPPANGDADSLTNGRERRLRTNPFAADTDADGLGDAAELSAGTDPRERDTDGDGYLDGAETRAGTSPTAPTGAVAFALAVVASALAWIVRALVGLFPG